jgi:hypothetical protein
VARVRVADESKRLAIRGDVSAIADDDLAEFVGK